ncbi:MAG TPA: zinc ABC transporter substrate-binding protein, partial [Candidatus Bathyarchaeia archaeon]|nr:zinc ABC transporter substrate-binding protein [Candidatus Bathyarchaeia archaeon]
MKYLRQRSYVVVTVMVVIVVAATATGVYLYYPSLVSSRPSSKIQIVAGENFWGSLVTQLGGTRVQALSIVTDPNADPHEYESNTANARAIASASLVIVNGAGYDDWALRLIAANGSPNQKVLNVANLLGKKQGDNPHFWYSPTYVNQTVRQMYLDLVSIDSASTSYYHQRYSGLNSSLAVYNGRIDEIRSQYAGTRIASTESIFEYLADAAGLDLISPPSFMQAVSEGNDPSPADIVIFQHQILSRNAPGNASVLVYNQQTVTPLTSQMKQQAGQASPIIPIVGVTETIQPPDVP